MVYLPHHDQSVAIAIATRSNPHAIFAADWLVIMQRVHIEVHGNRHECACGVRTPESHAGVRRGVCLTVSDPLAIKMPASGTGKAGQSRALEGGLYWPVCQNASQRAEMGDLDLGQSQMPPLGYPTAIFGSVHLLYIPRLLIILHDYRCDRLLTCPTSHRRSLGLQSVLRVRQCQDPLLP
jgi:hypothetical protein